MYDNFDEIIDINGLMEVLLIGRNTAYSLLNSGKIKAWKVGKKSWRIPRASVIEYIIKSCGSNS